MVSLDIEDDGLLRLGMVVWGSIAVVVGSVQENPCLRCLSIWRGCKGGGATEVGSAEGLSKLVLGVAIGVGRAGLLETCEGEGARIAAFSAISG